MYKYNYIFRQLTSIFLMASIILLLSSCNETPTNSKINPLGSTKFKSKITSDETAFSQVNLVSDNSAYNPKRIDLDLVNAWGITTNPTGIFWLASNGGNVSVVYDTLGNQKRPPVAIPTVSSSSGGAPSGVIFNPTTSDFVIPSNNQKSRFIFAQEDGIISAWSSGNAAIKVADRSATGAVYKGLAMGSIGSANYIYATNFHGRAVDVFDKNFNFVSSITFNDPQIPSDFSPFNIANIDGNLYVTYAKLKPPDNHDDLAGPSNGYVDVFKTDGSFIRRFITRGHLNSPWGIIKSPAGFLGEENYILVGNFGDGRINVYNESGEFRGRLKDSSEKPISIDGLWGLFFITNPSAGNTQWLYFTAGPDGESHGLFGYLKRNNFEE